MTFFLFWPDGFAALASLDNDHNGILEGSELENLALWRDQNSNGISDPGEVKPLKEWGIRALGLKSLKVEDGTLVCREGALFGDRWRPTFDVLLEPNQGDQVTPVYSGLEMRE